MSGLDILVPSGQTEALVKALRLGMEKYESGDAASYIPMQQWGKDHWSTFAYLETRVVDYKGVVDNRRMRCNPRLHRAFAHSASFGSKEYPTRLSGGVEEHNHDDWSCVEDMAAAGMIVLEWDSAPSEPFGRGKAKVSLTPLGQDIASLLREHKGKGGTFGNFACRKDIVEAT